MKKHLIVTMIAVACMIAGAVPAWAQYGRVEGKVTDKDVPQPNLQVIYKSQTNGRQIKLKTDKKGQFMAIGVPIDKYSVSVLDASGKTLFNQDGVSVGASGDTDVNTMDIDITKGATAKGAGSSSGMGGAPGGRTSEFHSDNINAADVKQKTSSTSANMSKEEYEKVKAQREKAININAMIGQAMTAMNNKQWDQAIPLLKQLTEADPERWDIWAALGDSQLNAQQFEDATQSYGKGIELAQGALSNNAPGKEGNSDPAKVKAGLARMLNNEGAAFLKLKKNDQAVDAYTKAAAMDPNPATAYFNLCATQYNTGNTQGALLACDKAIAADPNKADAYFIKGSLMVGDSKLDKDGKMTAPPGTAEALNKYLELQPDGPHAKDVKEMLAAIGSKVQTTYNEKKKK